MIPWDDAKYFEKLHIPAKILVTPFFSFVEPDITLDASLQIGVASSVAKFPSQGVILMLGSLDSDPQVECFSETMEMPGSQRENE